MQPAVLIRLRPAGPWRYGPGEGGRDRVDSLYRSDRLYSAVTIAMQQLGYLDEWLDTTARNGKSTVAFASLFPFQADTLFAPPPSTLWPPPASLVTTPTPVFLSKIRWSVARFVPLSLIESILIRQSILADQWIPDPESGCLLRRDRPSASPFHIVVRSHAAVDRLSSGSAAVHSSAGVEFDASSGLWTVVLYSSKEAQDRWDERVRAAFRVLADTGFGGRRSYGWGQIQKPEFQSGSWPGIVMPKLARLSRSPENAETDSDEPQFYWMLSLFSPSASDAVDWTRGDYALTVRGGHVHGGGREKKRIRMTTEGSVLAFAADPVGTAVDVAPQGFEHPVYRAGFAVALKLPSFADTVVETGPVETPSDAEGLESVPCAPPRPVAEPGPQTEPEAEAEPATEPEPEAATQAELEAATEPEPEQTVEPHPQAEEVQPEPGFEQVRADEPVIEEPAAPEAEPNAGIEQASDSQPSHNDDAEHEREV